MGDIRVLTLAEEIRRTREAIKNLEHKLNTLQKTLNELCQHEEVRHEDHSYEGSYYDKSRTERWTVCVHCNNVLEQKTVYVGSYG